MKETINMTETKEEMQNETFGYDQKLSMEDIEARNYTYVSVILKNGKFEKFIVSSPMRKIALLLARQYVAKQGWDLDQWNDGDERDKFYRLYPRNYVRKARILYDEGKYL